MTSRTVNIQDGVLVGWVDEKGIPVAAAPICLIPDSTTEWAIELQSLSSGPFWLRSEKNGVWRPRQPGVEWQVCTDAQIPSDSKALRLAQMRSLARRFRGDDDFEKEKSVLRLLPSPLVRYSNVATGLVDGALFAFVHGTDPEMLIMIEARQNAMNHVAFHWALAPMTAFELRAYLDRVQVWHKPEMTSNRRTDIFLQRQLVDEAPSVLSNLRSLFGF